MLEFHPELNLGIEQTGVGLNSGVKPETQKNTTFLPFSPFVRVRSNPKRQANKQFGGVHHPFKSLTLEGFSYN